MAIKTWYRNLRCLCGFVLVLAAGPAAAQQVITIEKSTNGFDADAAPGPALLVGSPVSWTYVVTNIGGRDLLNVSVTDDQGVTVTCPKSTLEPGESMTCTASGTAQAGQYANIGTAAGTEAGTPEPVLAQDPSHYFGVASVAVSLEKATNGQDADLPPGPVLPVGAAVSWTYLVTNQGTEQLTDISIEDDQGVTVTCPKSVLDPAESMTCTASGTAQAGQYANLGTVTAYLPSGAPTLTSDPSHYFGQTLLLEKATNGEDADSPPGPFLEIGASVAWTYLVTNPGPEAITGVAVSDDQGVTVTCPKTTLAAGESMTCTAGGVATSGQYTNIGTATALLPGGGTLTTTDRSHYFGQVLRLVKATNGADADTSPGPVLAVGAAVSWTYDVTNLGADEVAALAVTDDQGVTVTCPQNTLAGGASMTCTASGTAQAGQYTNTGTVTATHPTLGEVAASDSSHYYGQDEILDFGDAPDPTYLTLLASNGARHTLGSGVFLGACVDSELDGQPSAAAGGDDTAAGGSTSGACAVPGDDEDGVSFTTPIIAGSTGHVDVVASSACTLSAWIDFNGDGDLGDPGETLFPGGQPLAAGLNSLTFAVPAEAAPGATFARFRCATEGELPPAGPASDGEVEDYEVTVLRSRIGAAKLMTATSGPPFHITIDYTFSNLGQVPLGDLSAEDDLTAVFGSFWTLTGIATTAGPATFAHNAAFTGAAGQPELIQTASSLAAGEVGTIRVTLSLSEAGSYTNQVTVSGEDPGGARWSDDSTDGVDPDPNHDEDPAEADMSTLELQAENVVPALGAGGAALMAAVLAAAALVSLRRRRAAAQG
ncbi:MAG: GEVED domain-containing protein [Acidobacteriota bacterium]